MPDRPLRPRTAARVERVHQTTSYPVIKAWRGGSILAPVPTAVLVQATGLTRDQLPGAELAVRADLDALLDWQLDLRDVRLLRPARSVLAA
jgi:hypothetical protein